MTKQTDLELRLAVIERRQQLLFDTLKRGNVSLVHHWKRAQAWVMKQAIDGPPAPAPEPKQRIATADPGDPLAYVEEEPEPASPWRDEEGNVIQIEAHPATQAPVRSVAEKE